MKLAALLLAAALAACGGGGGGSTPVSGAITPAPPWVAGKFWGYFGDFDGQYAATSFHTNLAWIWAWNSDPTTRLREARAQQIPFAVVGLWWAFTPNDEATTEKTLLGWAASGLLAPATCITPKDEPQLEDLAKLNAWLDMVARIKARNPVLANVCVAILYDHYVQPAIERFDLIAWDDYHLGCEALNGELADLEARTRPTQDLLVVSGGAFGQDPACYLRTIMADRRVLGGLAFIYGNGWNVNDRTAPGIEGLPVQRRQYCEAGRYVLTGISAGC